MNRRKIQKTGGSSFNMTLPKAWVKRWQLQDKDEVILSPQESGALLVQPAHQVHQNHRMLFNVDNTTTKIIEREIFSRYIIGADEIVISGQSISPLLRNHIRAVTQFLFGLEIVDESATEILIRNIFDLSTLSPTDTVDKLFRMTMTMFKDVLQALRENDHKLAQDVITRDSEVDKLQLIITRQFHSLLQGRLREDELHMNASQLHYYEKVAVQLERIADHASKIAEAILLANRPPKKVLLSKPVTKTTDTLIDLLEKMAGIVHSPDNAQAHSVLDTNPTLEKQIDKIRIATQNETYRGLIMEIGLDRLRGYIMNIAEMTIDYSLEKSLTPSTPDSSP